MKNKNSLTEMNNQLLKIETTHPNNTVQIQEQKINIDNLKRIRDEKKTTLPSL